VSVAIFSVFSCTELASGVAYLDADVSIVCYEPQHWKYMGAAIVWLFIVPMGVPVFFIWLLHRFKVPQMAELINDSAWVREAVQLAWQSGMAQPACDVAKLNVDSISDAHLEGMYAFFVRSASAKAAGEIASGEMPPLPDEVATEALPPTGFVAKTMAKLQAAAARVAAAQQHARLSASASRRSGVRDATPQELRRAFVLEALLAWCKTSGKLALPPLAWEVMDDAGEAPTRSELLDKEADKPAATAHAATLHYKDLPHLQAAAMRDVGFLFAAYHTKTWCGGGLVSGAPICSCMLQHARISRLRVPHTQARLPRRYWEVVELMRKLALTSILSLIAPGSAGQVVVGLLLAFMALMANMRLKPYAQDGLNFVSQVSQVNLFFFLFVALLLKVNLDGQADAGFFSFIVGIMSIVRLCLACVARVQC
jgi:hypothetical protein